MGGGRGGRRERWEEGEEGGGREERREKGEVGGGRREEGEVGGRGRGGSGVRMSTHEDIYIHVYGGMRERRGGVGKTRNLYPQHSMHMYIAMNSSGHSN